MSERFGTFEEELDAGKPVVYFTLGNSMEPLLYNRDTHVVIVKSERHLRGGELPLYKRANGQCVMHRVIHVDDEAYYTRGDNCCELERVPKERVLGVVTEIYRCGRKISVNDRSYKLYVTIWGLIFPLRRIFYRARAFFARVRKAAK